MSFVGKLHIWENDIIYFKVRITTFKRLKLRKMKVTSVFTKVYPRVTQ